MTDNPHYSLEAAIEHLRRIQKMSTGRSWRIVVRKFNPGGMSGHGTTEVESIHAGFDWEAGLVVIYPAKPLTELTPEQVDAIEKSVRSGSSWHAYEAQKRLRERALTAEARVAELELQLATPAAGERPNQAPGWVQIFQRNDAACVEVPLPRRCPGCPAALPSAPPAPAQDRDDGKEVANADPS